MGKQPKTRSVEKTQQRRRKYRGAQRRTSVFFLLWTIFSVFTLFVVALFGVTQQYTLSQAYKNEASKEVSQKGSAIERMVGQGVPEWLGGNWSSYLRLLSVQYDARVMLLNGDGDIVFPTEPSIDSEHPDYKDYFDYSKEIQKIKLEMNKTGAGYVLFEGDGEYVYAAECHLFGETPLYLYVGESLELMEQVISHMNVRMLLMAGFTFALGFAIASAVAGWLTKPLAEMTERRTCWRKGILAWISTAAITGRKWRSLRTP